MATIERRLDAIEKKLGNQRRPVVVVYEGDEIPEGTPLNALIVQVVYDGNKRGRDPLRVRDGTPIHWQRTARTVATK